MKKYFDLLRVKHWIKNLLVFIPLVSANIINYNTVYSTILGFFAFSFVSSFVYIINDLKDIEKDKKHPKKKDRPLPSGKISKNVAIIIAFVLLLFAMIINFMISKTFFNNYFMVLMIYLIINILYSFGLKNVAIIDVFLLASGFVLRVYYGACISDIKVSNWLFLTILCASLFMGLGKRKKELIVSKESRKVLNSYNEQFLEKFQYIFLSLLLVFYSLWTMEQDTQYLIFTIPLVIIIFMKYSLIIETKNEGDPTEIVYSDKLLLLLCTIYSILMILLLVVFK